MNTNSNAHAGSDSKTLNSDANNENEHHNRGRRLSRVPAAYRAENVWTNANTGSEPITRRRAQFIKQ